MKQADKDLLLKDLCSRLPYNVMVLEDLNKEFDGGCIGTLETITYIKEVPYIRTHGSLTPMDIEEIRPYLRPMSSMTEEEKTTIARIATYASIINITDEMLEFCCSRHLDWRGLIEKGLALEAKEGMYKL